MRLRLLSTCESGFLVFSFLFSSFQELSLIEEYTCFTSVFFSICTLVHFPFVGAFIRSFPFVFHLGLLSLLVSCIVYPLPLPDPSTALHIPLLTFVSSHTFVVFSSSSYCLTFSFIPASSDTFHLPSSFPSLPLPRFPLLPPYSRSCSFRSWLSVLRPRL